MHEYIGKLVLGGGCVNARGAARQRGEQQEYEEYEEFAEQKARVKP